LDGIVAFMTQKLLSTLAAIAVAGVFVPSTAQALTAGEFKEALAQKVGNKKNFQAYAAASRVLGKFSRDDPQKVRTWASLVRKFLIKVAKPTAKGVTVLLKQMTFNIFKSIKYTTKNSKLNAGIKLLIKKLPSKQKKTPLIDKMFNVFKQLNARKNGTQTQLQDWRNLVYRAAGLPVPIS
jgi:hypothetical protein